MRELIHWVQAVYNLIQRLPILRTVIRENPAGGPGLDTSYPYDTGLYAEEWPYSDALSPTIETSGNNSLNFTMYLMSPNPLTTGGSIASANCFCFLDRNRKRRMELDR